MIIRGSQNSRVLRCLRSLRRNATSIVKEIIMDKPLFSLTAADLMSRNLVLVPQEMSLQGAARLLSGAQVSGAPVVDGQGRCRGVLSNTDFLHWAETGHPKKKAKEEVCRSWQIYEEETPDTETVE